MRSILTPYAFEQIFVSSDSFEFTDFFVNEFSSNGVVLLRGFDCDYDTQEIIAIKFKQKFSTFFNQDDNLFHEYDYHHCLNFKLNNSTSFFENAAVYWHMDDFAMPNPTKGAIWNMKKFDCDTESGQTILFDSTKLTESIAYDELEILKKCSYHYLIKDSSENLTQSISFCPVQNHILSGKESFMINPTRQFYIDQCEEGKLELCDSLLKNILTKIYTNKEYQTCHHWQKNDILFVDLSRMYHSVLGGFNQEETSCLISKIK